MSKFPSNRPRRWSWIDHDPGVFVDLDLDKWARAGGVVPFIESNVNPTSINLTLMDQIRIPREGWSLPDRSDEMWANYKLGKFGKESPFWENPKKFDAHLLYPGQCALCATREIIHMPEDCCGMIFLRSTAGRMMLEHAHATWIEPDFTGTITLEFSNPAPWPFELISGDSLIQLVLIRASSIPWISYSASGHYSGQFLPTASPHDLVRL